MSVTPFDVSYMGNIMLGEGDWFTAKLLRLMRDADESNLRILAGAFPEEFIAFCMHMQGGVPARFVTITTVANLMEYKRRTTMPDEPYPQWIGNDGKTHQIVISRSGRDF